MPKLLLVVHNTFLCILSYIIWTYVLLSGIHMLVDGIFIESLARIMCGLFFLGLTANIMMKIIAKE